MCSTIFATTGHVTLFIGFDTFGRVASLRVTYGTFFRGIAHRPRVDSSQTRVTYNVGHSHSNSGQGQLNVGSSTNRRNDDFSLISQLTISSLVFGRFHGGFTNQAYV